MKLLATLLLLFLAAIFATSHGIIPNQIHTLRPHSGSGGTKVPGINCLSWRLAVETNNIQDWDVVPMACENYIGHYLLGHQYRKDCRAAADAAYDYAKGLNLTGDGKDVWVFDLDETAISNMPYYARPDVAFGAKEYNETSFDEWQQLGIAPALPAIRNLYKRLLKLGFKIVFLSGKSVTYRDVTTKNLKNIGYYTWEKLILKETSESGKTAVEYKSGKRKELVGEGYRILGNMGDQWSDLLGPYPGKRTFKVPDPMYYIS